MEEFHSVMKKMPNLKNLEWSVLVEKLQGFRHPYQDTSQTKANPLWTSAFQNRIAAMCQGLDHTINHHAMITPEVK